MLAAGVVLPDSLLAVAIFVLAVPVGAVAINCAFFELRDRQFRQLRESAGTIWDTLVPTFFEANRQNLRDVLDRSPWPDDPMADKGCTERDALAKFARSVYPLSPETPGALVSHSAWGEFKQAMLDMRDVLEAWGWGNCGPELRAMIRDEVSVVHLPTLKLYWYLLEAKGRAVGVTHGRYGHLTKLRKLMQSGSKPPAGAQ